MMVAKGAQATDKRRVVADQPMTDEALDGGLTELYRQHRPEILRFLIARMGSAAEAEDVVQDLWIKARSVPSGPVANGRAYLFRMAQNIALDRVRARKRRESCDQGWSDLESGPVTIDGDIADSRLNAREAMEEREEIARLTSAIGTLPAGARRVFQMHKIDGRSHGDVAAALGISKSAVEKHMAVAMKYLRRALAD
jgi:RNA polymerase sigma-70 factor (ECF subfamily)